MKICFIRFGFYSPDSVLTPLYEYSQILSRRNLEVTVFVLSDKDNLPDQENLKIRGVCRVYLNHKATRLFFLIKLISILRKERFDVVHVFSMPGACLLPVFCGKRQGRWVLDIRTGTDQYGIKNYLLDKLTHFEAHFFDKVIVLSQGLKEKFFGENSSSKIHVIPLGANLKRFKRAMEDRNNWKFQDKDNCQILIYVGKISANKKIENVLKAFRIVLKKSRKELRLVIIGGHKKDLIKPKEESKRLGISEYVTFLGRVEYKEIPYYLANADIGLSYIPKSRIYDVQPPLKTFEYLAACLPVVATNTEGNLEIIDHGYNGLIAADDYQDYADKILRLLNDRELRNRIIKNAVNSIRKYDWDHITDHITQIYWAA